MMITVLKKELTDNLLSFRFIITLLLCLVLIPLAIYVSTQDYKNSLTDYQQSETLYRESMQGTKNPQDVEAKGLRPPAPFGIFAGGLDRFLPNEIKTDRKDGVSMGNNRTLDSPISILFGRLDFLFIIGIVMTLLAILFTFDAVTREKERGTLRLMLSNSLPRHQILLGKFAGNYITFLIPFTLAVLVSILILNLSGIFPVFAPGNLVRLLLILLVSLIFISVFFNLGLMVTALSQRSLTSQIILLFLWIVLIFAVPRASGMLAEIIVPVKTQQTVNLEKSLVRKNIRDEKSNALKQIFADSQGEASEGDSYDQRRSPIVNGLKEKQTNELENIDQDFLNKKDQQLQVAAVLSRISPLSSFTYALTELSTTGLRQMNTLRQSSKIFYDEVERDIYSMGYYDEIAGYGMRMNFGGWVSYDDIPKFQMQGSILADTFRAIWIDLLLLVLFNLLFFTGAYVAFLRYDVR